MKRGTDLYKAHNNSPSIDLAEILAESLGINYERATKLLESKSTRTLRYKNIRYIALRRDLGNHYEGTAILIDEKTGEYRVVEGYPHIKRVLLLSKAVPQHFVDWVIVEEKMDGHNVRVIKFKDGIYAVTRGGYICPYTTARMRHEHGKSLENLIDAIGEEAVVAGEVVGLENPYTRYYYPEAPEWGFFVFDIFRKGLDPLSVEDRRRLVEEYGLRNVPLLGKYHKDDWQGILEVVSNLEEVGREGVVMKDPYYRVDPLKYTTSYINTKDIQEGMKYPFDEGHSFIYPRVLRQMFKAIEDDWDEEKLAKEAQRLGEAILVTAVESVKRFLRGMPIAEEFMLTFYNMRDFEDFVSHITLLGVPITIVSIDQASESYIKVKILKHKKTPEYYKRILRTGLSPLD